jgi:hypothetical protein
MTGFFVVPGALRSYADTLSAAATNGGINLATDFFNTAPPYVDKYLAVDRTSGLSDLFEVILSSNETLVTNVRDTYSTVGMRMSMSGLALADSADLYEATDDEANARMDKLWPGAGKVPEIDSGAGGGKVAEAAGPLNAVPSEDVLIPDPVHWIMDQAGWFSVGDNLLKIANIFGLDPASSLTKLLAGDYGLVARAGHAATALADFERNVAESMAAGLATMTTQWTGHAADQATSYFTQFVNAFEDHASQLDEVASKYAQIAQALAQVAELLGGLLATAIDKLLICLAKLAAAGCLAEIPGVNVIAGIIGAYSVWQAKEAVAAFLKATSVMADTCEAVVALAVGISGLCTSGSADAAFPAVSYANGAQQ